MNNVTHINKWNDENFNLEVLGSSKLVLLEIRANWCGTSHILMPILESIANDYNNQIRICKLDFDNTKEIQEKYGINEIPVILFFNEGKIVDKIIGIASKKEITRRINSILNTSQEEKKQN